MALYYISVGNRTFNIFSLHLNLAMRNIDKSVKLGAQLDGKANIVGGWNGAKSRGVR